MGDGDEVRDVFEVGPLKVDVSHKLEVLHLDLVIR